MESDIVPLTIKVTMVNKVTFKDDLEPIRVRIEKSIESKKFDFIPLTSERLDWLSGHSGIGVICDDPTRTYHTAKKFLFFGKNEIKPQRVCFCGLWINNDGAANSAYTPWLLEVYGEDFIEKAKKLANELSTEFDVYIEIKFVNKYPIDI